MHWVILRQSQSALVVWQWQWHGAGPGKTVDWKPIFENG